MTDSDELGKLGELHERGVLSDDEFARAKARVLSGAAGASQSSGEARRLRRSRDDRWIGGVCGGIARTTGIESWIWRLLFTVLFLFGGTGFLLYILLWIFVPEESVD